jgi:hypothetical protein
VFLKNKEIIVCKKYLFEKSQNGKRKTGGGALCLMMASTGPAKLL